MESTDTVRCILARKGNRVISVPPEASVLDALTRMAGEDVGAVAVMKDGHLLGAFTERDYARKLVLLGRSSAETSVAEAMTQPATCVRPETTVDDCMRGILVTRSRHLFVMEDDQVIGVVSIGDLVNWIISAQAETITHLQSYIWGNYPA